jgi:NosR/NirI family transcriptional regulator, nitrous oxide reductase regulator
MLQKILKNLFLIILMLNLGTAIIGGPRFPMPEFESGHTQPPTSTPGPRLLLWEYIDVLLLIVALSVVTWFTHKKRSRRGVFWVSIFSLVYFGFIREGCLCSIGAIQNVVLALFNHNYTIPVTAIAIFIIPLVYTLFYGRTFCAGVCPLGAIQDIFALKPYNLKTWVQKTLGLIPFVYLGLAVLYAATASDFIICRYDPFVGFFRLDATFFMFSIGGMFLVTSIFIARPYCRFFCPYGVLLNVISRFSKKHITITPTNCIQCKLCENSCPFGAIDFPTGSRDMENKSTALRRFIILSVIIPVLVVIGGYTGSQFHENLALVNPKVHLAKEVLRFEKDPNLQLTEDIKAFRTSGKTNDDLYKEAKQVLGKFYIGGWILGGFIGLVFGLTLASVSIFRYRTDYEPNKGTCFSCARCFDYCPVKANNMLD